MPVEPAGTTVAPEGPPPSGRRPEAPPGASLSSTSSGEFNPGREPSAPEPRGLVELLVGREQARHQGEWIATREQLSQAVHQPQEALVAQLEDDLAATATAAITALERVRSARNAPPELLAERVSDHADPALAAAAAALRSALASHLAMAAQLRASPGQTG